MTATFLHGVETVEIDVSPRPIRQVRSAVIGLVGTAPLMDCASADQTVNVPKLIYSDRLARQYFGTVRSGFTIPQALDAIFDHGFGVAVVINVLDPAEDKTAVTDESKTFGDADTITLAHPQIVAASVTVTSSPAGTTYAENTHYTVDYANGVITRVATGTITVGQTVLVDYSWLDPSKVSDAQLIGEVDNNGDRTGMQGWLDAEALFGFKPKILIVPGYSSDVDISTEMIALAETLRAIALIDAPIGTTVEEAITGRGAEGTINFNVASDRAVLCFPHLTRYDSATDATVNEPMSQRLAGLIAQVDDDQGYWWSPSNHEFAGVNGVELAISASINDANSDANLLNEAGICTVFNAWGTGLRFWGNRTAAWPSVTHPRNFINIRRVADVIHDSIEYNMIQFLDQPINDALIDAITESVNAFMRTLVGRGALVDGVCRYDPNKNPPTELALGHLTFDVSFCPPPPAERITFESYIDIALLGNLQVRSS